MRKELTDEWIERGVSKGSEFAILAGNARKEIEAQTGKPVITSKNAQDYRRILGDVIEAAAAELSDGGASSECETEPTPRV